MEVSDGVLCSLVKKRKWKWKWKRKSLVRVKHRMETFQWHCCVERRKSQTKNESGSVSIVGRRGRRRGGVR